MQGIPSIIGTLVTAVESLVVGQTYTPIHCYDAFAVNAAFTAGLLEADAGDGAVVCPDAAFLSVLTFTVSGLAGGATTFTWYLAHDAAGVIAITPPKTITLSSYLTKTAGSYAYAERLEVEYQRTGGAGPYFTCMVNVGTAAVVSRLYLRSKVTS